MIIVKLIGGLGNQMFQYATGRRLAYIKNQELKLDISGFESYDLWKYELGNYNILENIASKEDLRCIVYPKSGFQIMRNGFNFLFNREKNNLHDNMNLKVNYYKEKHFYYDPKILEQSNNLYLDGYWQSEKYFKDIENLIKSEFTLKKDLSGKNLKIAEKIRNSQSVSLHVRRGDYVSNPQAYNVHGVCSLDYYNRAINHIISKVENPSFFIFSDDPEWTKENLFINADIEYISHNDPSKGYEDLRLMGLCNHHIIANSSFSWWGAWLNKNPNKVVIAPKRWFRKKEFDTSDLLPDDWMKI